MKCCLKNADNNLLESRGEQEKILVEGGGESGRIYACMYIFVDVAFSRAQKGLTCRK